MKKLIIAFMALTTISFFSCHQTEAKNMKNTYTTHEQSVFPKGEPLKSPYFTGKVWLKMLVDEENTFNCPIGNVTFEPGCRNNWHKHPGGQILLVTNGRGYYQEKGNSIQSLHPGDVVKIAPHVEHWHGAAPDSWFTHLAISTNPQAGPAQWLQPVTDEEYNGLQARRAVPLRLSEAAVKNREKLFPGRSSSLQATDPELVEVFDNFTFDEVLGHGNLDSKTRTMVILAALIAGQALNEYTETLDTALATNITPVEAKEILYQAVPYVGMAKVYDFIHATNETLSARGVALPLEGQSATSPETRHDKGLEVQKAIFGEVIDKMYQESPANQRHLQKYLSGNCFGDYYTRNGLDVRMRELLTFAMILTLGGCEPQLKGHIQGNVNVGNDKGTLLSAITQLLPYVGYPRTLNAVRCLNEVIPE